MHGVVFLRFHVYVAATIADGLKTNLGDLTWPIIRGLFMDTRVRKFLRFFTLFSSADFVDDIVTVNEDEIIAATRFVWERMKICIEPSAGVPVSTSFSFFLSLNLLSASHRLRT